MTFNELKQIINKMDDVELRQLVMVHLSDGEYEIDMAVKHTGRVIFVLTYGDDDDSAMDAG